MCLVVYIGLNGKLDGFSDLPAGGFGLEPNPHTVPPILSDRAIVYGVSQWGGDRWCCSCDLYHHHLPWEDEQPEEDTVHAYRTLRDIVETAQARALKPELFSSWNGEENLPLVVEWVLSPRDLIPENNLFEEYEKTGGARPPPSVFRFLEDAAGPTATYLRPWACYEPGERQ